ncbi:AI-2E family transporter [Natronomonas salina]|uniref:AI-2E family transporter n=1 Tax=Natronomonas salina TaxID=1710540 RepID=UPI0015B40236|nr:AI-2E family transporter [Natronomonas salina]QLD87803.1 AI-2E family transporter [Natronomonas salina]
MLRDVSRPRLAWWTVGAVLAFVVGTALLAFTGTLVTALFLYYVCRPVYRRLRPRVGRNLAAVGAMIALAIPIVLLVTYTVAITIQEIQTLAENVDLGPLQEVVSPYFDISSVVQDPASLLQNSDFMSALNVVIEGAFSYLPLVLTFLLNLFIALAVTFYLLRDGDKLAGWIRHTFGHDTGVFDTYARAVDEDLSSVYFGNILNAVLAAIIAAIAYHALNLLAPAGGAIPYPALLGMLIGAASLIPVVGMKIVYPPVAILLFAQAVSQGDPLWFPVAFFLVSVVIIDFIPDIVLRPYVSGRNLHVGLVMIAYIVGPVFFGWYGLFLGPLLLVLVFHFARHVLPALLDDGPIRPVPAFTEATAPDEYLEGEVATDDSAGTEGGGSTGGADDPGPH